MITNVINIILKLKFGPKSPFCFSWFHQCRLASLLLRLLCSFLPSGCRSSTFPPSRRFSVPWPSISWTVKCIIDNRACYVNTRKENSQVARSVYVLHASSAGILRGCCVYVISLGWSKCFATLTVGKSKDEKKGKVDPTSFYPDLRISFFGRIDSRVSRRPGTTTLRQHVSIILMTWLRISIYHFWHISDVDRPFFVKTYRFFYLSASEFYTLFSTLFVLVARNPT